MGFAGLKKPADRANILAYLRSLADDPAPLPQAAAAEMPAPEAAAPAAAMEEAAKPETAMAAPAPAAEAETAAPTVAQEPAAEAAPAEAAPADTAPAETAPVETPAVEVPAAETTMVAPAPATESAPAEAPAAEAPAAAPAMQAAPSDAADSPVLAMIGEKSADDGKKVAKKCAACHSFDEGGKNKVGPPLWGIMNRTAGMAENFKYSDAMKAFGEGGGTWDYATLDAYLVNPKGKVPKTKMSFSGLKKEKDRAAILAYMRTLAGEPVPLP